MKFLTIVLMLMAVQNSFGSCSDKASYELQADKKLEIDVINHGVVYFSLQESKNMSVLKIAIEEEHANFSCDIVSVEIKNNCLVVGVDWVPGADYSGCELVVNTRKQKTRALLYMMYD